MKLLCESTYYERRVVRGDAVKLSEYVQIWANLGGLPTTPEQDMACLFLEGKGLRFCVDYGYENAIGKAHSYADWRTPGRA